MYFAKIILTILGWKTTINPEAYKILKEHKRIIVLYPHTTYWDFFFCIMYLLTDKKMWSRAVILVNPGVMHKFGFILRHLRCLESSRLEDRNSGKTQKIINFLKEKDDFIFLMSPKGTVQKAEWRSGWYHISKSIEGTKLTVFGPDYQDHTMRGYLVPDRSSDKEAQKREVVRYMKEIAPLNPERSEFLLSGNVEEHEISLVPFDLKLLYLGVVLSGLLWFLNY